MRAWRRQAAAVCLEGGECVVSGFSCVGRLAPRQGCARGVASGPPVVHMHVLGSAEHVRAAARAPLGTAESACCGNSVMWPLWPLDCHTCACHPGARTSPAWQPRLPPTLPP